MRIAKKKVFKNVSFDSGAIKVIAAIVTVTVFSESNCLYRSEVLLFGHVDLQRKPLFGNRKYICGTLPRVWEVILNAISS